MDMRTPSIEWTITENDADWERLHVPPLPDITPAAGRRLYHYFWCMSTLLLLLASAGGWLWHAERVALPQPIAQVTAPAQPALGATAPDSDGLVASIISNQRVIDWWRQVAKEDSSVQAAVQREPDAHVDVVVRTVGFQGDQAVARVVMPAQNGAPAYRQTRFYRRMATGWVQTAPDAALWGPERSLETPYFVYHFRQNDAQAVVAILPQMNAFYTTLWRNLGLPIIPTPEKLVIDVSVTQRPGQAVLRDHGSDRVIVPSPAVYVAPVELTDAELLAQSIALPLLDDVLAQASEQYQIDGTWRPMLNGLHLWQVWDLDLPLAAWRTDIVKWLYVDLPAIGPGQSFVLPERHTALCAAHKLWLPSPLQLDIPLLCARSEWEAQYLRSLRDPPTRLDQFAMSEPQSWLGESFPLSHPGQAIALATLIEYAVATYGRERLPVLVAGLGQYESWDTLLPAVYGVSPADFEAGWQAYLAAHYGVSIAHQSGSEW